MDDGRLRYLAHVAAYRAPCAPLRENTTIRVISPLISPYEMARALQTCDLVASSAMHGVIAADALRVCYAEYSALRFGGDLIFKILKRVVAATLKP